MREIEREERDGGGITFLLGMGGTAYPYRLITMGN